MAGMTKVFLSADSNGDGVLVAATATVGTLIHTSVAGTTQFDEVYLYAHNTSTAAVLLTIEVGGSATVNQIKKTIPAQDGAILVVPGFPMNNANTINAFAATANVINIHGWVNRGNL